MGWKRRICIAERRRYCSIDARLGSSGCMLRACAPFQSSSTMHFPSPVCIFAAYIWPMASFCLVRYQANISRRLSLPRVQDDTLCVSVWTGVSCTSRIVYNSPERAGSPDNLPGYHHPVHRRQRDQLAHLRPQCHRALIQGPVGQQAHLVVGVCTHSLFHIPAPTNSPPERRASNSPSKAPT
jgi:hypothetical protein